MTTPHTRRPTPVTLQFLCLWMAGLTACGTARPQHVWRDLGVQAHRETGKTTPGLDTWGAESEGVDVLDPVIAPGFLLTITSLTDRKLNGEFRTDFDGNLQAPYDINVNTNGMTLSQLKRKLVGLYRPFFKSSPDIDIRVKERRYWLEVRGLVQKPGRVLVEQNASLDQVIAIAGGADKDSPPQFARIQKGSKLFVLDLNQYFSQGEAHPQILGWLGGELVFLQKEYVGSSVDRTSSTPYRLPLYMLGEVRKPGEYPLKPGSDFVDLLIQANGFTERADLDHIEIIRRTAGRKRSYEFSWDDFQHAPTPIQGDVIVVHADSRKVELRMQIAAILVSIITSAAIIYELDRTNNLR